MARTAQCPFEINLISKFFAERLDAGSAAISQTP